MKVLIKGMTLIRSINGSTLIEIFDNRIELLSVVIRDCSDDEMDDLLTKVLPNAIQTRQEKIDFLIKLQSHSESESKTFD